MLIEMHAHAIYGVDDGARNAEEMQRMLAQAADSGVTKLYCTTHYRPDIKPYPEADYKAHFLEACRWCRKNAPQLELYSGAEVRYSRDTRRLLMEGQAPAYEGSSLVLLEFRPDTSRRTIVRAVEQITGDGWHIMLAHVERCRALYSMSFFRAFREDTGLFVQMNADTVFDEAQGFFGRRFVRALLGEGGVDCVSSDAHSPTGRNFCLQYAHHWLSHHIGKKQADDLCGDNFAKIIRM